MEIWAIYAIGASFLWALVNVADKYLVSKYAADTESSGALVLFSSLIGVFIAAGIGTFVSGVWGTPFYDKLLLMLSGAMSVVWIIFYLRSLEIEDVSMVVPWFLTAPIFGYIFGFLFLGETLTNFQKIGSLIVLLGLALLNVDLSAKNKFRLNSRVTLYMTIACIIVSLQGIVFKYVTVVDDFWKSSFWEYAGLGLTGVLVYIFVHSYRKQFNHLLKNGGKLITSLNISSELVSVGGNLMSGFALLLAPVTLVYLFGSFQPAFVLMLTVLGTIFFPGVVKENIDKRVLAPKAFAILVTIVGSYILFL